MPASIVGDWQASASAAPYVTNELVEDKQVRHDNLDGWAGVYGCVCGRES